MASKRLEQAQRAADRANMPVNERARSRPLLPGTVQIQLTRARLLRVRVEGQVFKVLVWRLTKLPPRQWDWHYAEGMGLVGAIADALGHDKITQADREIAHYARARLLGWKDLHTGELPAE